MTDLPPWPGPLTRESTWVEVYDRLLHHEDERRRGGDADEDVAMEGRPADPGRSAAEA